MADTHRKSPSALPDPGCVQPSIDNPDGAVLMPTTWIDPQTGAAVPTDARCTDCGELFGQHRHLDCCVEVCSRCGEQLSSCECPDR